MSRLAGLSATLTRGVLLLTVATSALLGGARPAQADTLVFIPPASNDQRGDLQDLDSLYVYTWLFTNIKQALPNQDVNTITGAKLTFANVANSSTDANKLFMHLLDSALTSGSSLTQVGSNTTNGIVSSVFRAQDDPTAVLRDDLGRDNNGYRYEPFSDKVYYPQTAPKMVDPKSANTPIGDMTGSQHLAGSGSNSLDLATAWAVQVGGSVNQSFSATPSHYELDLTPYLDSLRAYIESGNDFALGFDPDGHFFNEGITLEIYTGGAAELNLLENPEPASMILLGSGLAALVYRRRRASKAAQA